MSYVVTNNCLRCLTPICVTVCPTDSFHLGPDMLVINPNNCVECALCVEQCVTKTIYRAQLVSDAHEAYIAHNAQQAQLYPRLSHVA